MFFLDKKKNIYNTDNFSFPKINKEHSEKMVAVERSFFLTSLHPCKTKQIDDHLPPNPMSVILTNEKNENAQCKDSNLGVSFQSPSSLSTYSKCMWRYPSSVSIFRDFLGGCCVKMTFCWEQKRRLTPSAVVSRMMLFEKQLSLKRVICLFIYARFPFFNYEPLESALWSPRRDHWGRHNYLISQEFTLKLQLHCDEKRIGGKWLNPNQSVDSIFFCYTENWT